MSVTMMRSAVRCNASARVTMPRTNFAKVQTVRVSRPAGLQSEFKGTGLKSLTASFAGLVLSPLRKALGGIGRQTLVVEANNKKGLGSTLHGTRRKRARVSGFRVRMSTVGGRKVLKARRVKGRKRLTPGGRPVRK